MKKYWVVVLVYLFSAVYDLQAQVENYGIASQPWDEQLGNHRAVIEVTESSQAVQLTIHWRRRDTDLLQKRLLLLDEQGRQIRNLKIVSINREEVKLFFEPVSGKGRYYCYYMPYQGKKNVGWWEGAYLKAENTATEEWANGLNSNANDFPIAKVVQLEARTAFDSFFPMEVCATEDERNQLIRANQEPILLFPEDRKNPIRMTTDLPAHWIKQGPSKKFTGRAQRNEYYVFQIGVFAAGTSLSDITVSSSNDRVTCFNTEGVDARGKAFTKKLKLEKGQVQALWIGVDVPEQTDKKELRFTVTVHSAEVPDQKVEVLLQIDDKLLADRGDSEPWRHSRLRWLNSRLGIDDQVVAPYQSLRVKGKLLTGKTAQLLLNDQGLPQQLKAKQHPILAAPIRFEMETGTGVQSYQSTQFRYDYKSPGKISWLQEAEQGQTSLRIKGQMEFDGSIIYQLTIKAKEQVVDLKDLRVILPVNKSVARYFMGIGLPGGACPDTYDWKWKGPQDAFWIGDVQAGLHVEMQGASYTGPLLNLYKPAPPASWYNGNRGGVRINTINNQVLASLYTGERRLEPGKELTLSFKLLVTPVKELDTKDQFVNRYFHNGNFPTPKLEDLNTGIKITNVHHANPINPYINYPFIAVDSMRNFVNYWHSKGLKVKIYYTIRELTNQLPELWALRSLGNEIFAEGKGGGFPWLREHLISGYDVQWFNKINGYEECDASILTSGESRWYNYYIEGLRWLVKNLDIDGLYLDDVSFDRNMLQRMRKVMDREKPGCLIDLHSNTGFSKGPATQYTEYFPYINKLWFGESFMYDQMPPDNWMVEVSGIPFGLMGDMLHGGGNPWKGPLYGMTVRYPWGTEGVTCDPRDIWKVWDQFGIKDAQMIGYWEKENPVRLSSEKLLATVYRNKGKLLISIGSWSDKEELVELQIDWKKLGINGAKAVINQPAIPFFQEEKRFDSDDKISVPSNKGVLLVIE
jgi:hypothetical protein